MFFGKILPWFSVHRGTLGCQDMKVLTWTCVWAMVSHAEPLACNYLSVSLYWVPICVCETQVSFCVCVRAWDWPLFDRECRVHPLRVMLSQGALAERILGVTVPMAFPTRHLDTHMKLHRTWDTKHPTTDKLKPGQSNLAKDSLRICSISGHNIPTTDVLTTGHLALRTSAAMRQSLAIKGSLKP